MKYTPVKYTLGAIAVAAVLAFTSGTAAATPANKAANVANGIESNHAASATDMSARHRRWRRHHYVRPFPYVYPYSYGYYRPRPYYYRPYYRPYYSPGPFFSFGFGPRYYW